MGAFGEKDLDSHRGWPSVGKHKEEPSDRSQKGVVRGGGPVASREASPELATSRLLFGRVAYLTVLSLEPAAWHTFCWFIRGPPVPRSHLVSRGAARPGPGEAFAFAAPPSGTGTSQSATIQMPNTGENVFGLTDRYRAYSQSLDESAVSSLIHF